MNRFLASAASIALVWSGQAHAQTATEEGVPERQTQPVSGEEGTLSLDQVTVTAQKRSERLVDVPVSITVVSNEALTLAGSDSLESLNKLVPGVYINTPVYYLSPTIRGVGSTLSVSNESNAAIYIDGVYQPSQASNVFDLASIESVDVLKGPQGTLFGRNATGGALLVNTLDPSFEPGGKFAASYARFGEARVKGYVNAPITDSVAANLAISYKDFPGYIRDLRTDRLVDQAETLAARGKLLIQPTDNLEIILTGSHTEFDDPAASSYQSAPGTNALAGVPGAGPVAVERGDLSHNTQDVIRTSAQEFNARVNYDIWGGTLSSITAKKRDTLTTTNDVDNTYLNVFRVDFTFQNNTFTQELNFSKSGDNYNYVVGGYYFHNNKYYAPFQYNLIDFLTADITAKAWAGFADGTYEFGDLAVIAGIRYSTEDRDMDNALLPHPLVAAPGSRSIKVTEDAWTPRVGLRYALNDRSNIYAMYSRGFKSGAFNGTSLTDPGVSPETIDAYEIGYKAAGERFAFSTAAFYYNYKDIQVNSLLITNGVALNRVVNAAEAEIMGIEAEATYQVSDALNVRAGLGYTDAEYSSFPNAPGYGPAPTVGFVTIPVNATGNTMVRSPKYQASAQINYAVPLGDKTLEFSLSPSYTGKVYFDLANQLSEDPVFVLDGAVSLNMDNGMKLSVFGRNITDEVYRTTRGYSTIHVAETYAKPVMYGVELSYDF